MKKIILAISLLFTVPLFAIPAYSYEEATLSIHQPNDKQLVGMPNPMTEVEAAVMVEKTGISLLAPEESLDTAYFVIDLADDFPMAQVVFLTPNGKEVTYRAKRTLSLELEDISGLYYEWPEAIDAKVDYNNAKIYCNNEVGYIGWLDIVPGIVYSLSMENATPEELEEMANHVFIPAQGDSYGDEQESISKIITPPSNALPSEISINVNGKPVYFTDAVPFIDENGRTLVPLRAAAEAMDLEVEWDGEYQVAIFSYDVPTEAGQIYHNSVIFTIGDTEYNIAHHLQDSNGVSIADGAGIYEMDTAPIIRNGRTYAPIRYLAEACEYAVDWDGATKTITLTTVGNY